MAAIKVGDTVTWRPAAKKPDFVPLGVTGCKVLELGHHSVDQEPIAVIWAFGERLNVFLAHLTKEEEC